MSEGEMKNAVRDLFQIGAIIILAQTVERLHVRMELPYQKCWELVLEWATDKFGGD